MTPPPFEPLEMLAVLEQHRVAYVVIGKLAGILHGTGGVADELEICPQIKDSNLARLQRALDELDARPNEASQVGIKIIDGDTRLRTPIGELALTPRPAGTRGGWDDLRRRARREALGEGMRAPVAAIEDLVRIAAAEGVSVDEVHALRRVAEASQDRGLGR